MSGLVVRVDGDARLRKALRAVAKRAPDRASKAVGATALFVQTEAKNRTPVDTGRLRSSLQIVFYNRGLTAFVGTNVEYAPYVEFGLRSRPNYPAQPYLGPAAERGRKELERRLIRAFRGLA